jgi:hypothetical protein
MWRLVTIFFCIVVITACGQNKNYSTEASSEYYANNEDKFGFLVFDKSSVDSFFKKYSPFEFNNPVLQTGFQNLTHADKNLNKELEEFKRHTKEPTDAEYELASKVLNGEQTDSGSRYFKPSLNYFFFYQCLPNQLKYKWPQIQSGDFNFNVTFFNLLRTKCKSFDDHIYGDNGYWDENIRTVFGQEMFNEITSEKAKEIKKCINAEKAFSDSKLQPDKNIFILLLDSTIAERWRLFLVDSN